LTANLYIKYVYYVFNFESFIYFQLIKYSLAIVSLQDI